MSNNATTLYLTKMIREGFEPADVNMWQALCQQAKTDVGDSRTYMFLLLDMARHNKVDVIEIVKTGRVCSEQKSINEKFMKALHECLTDDVETVEVGESSTRVLDLTCDEELSESGSGSYEETSEPHGFDDNENPTSAEAYEIDGFVVPDHHSDPESSGVEVLPPKTPQRGVKRLLKRKLEFSNDS